jgi:beta-lactamase superfamily II metal-dependent hydrolase
MLLAVSVVGAIFVAAGYLVYHYVVKPTAPVLTKVAALQAKIGTVIADGSGEIAAAVETEAGKVHTFIDTAASKIDALLQSPGVEHLDAAVVSRLHEVSDGFEAALQHVEALFVPHPAVAPTPVAAAAPAKVEAAPSVANTAKP